MENHNGQSRNRNSNTRWALGFGLLAGAAIGYYLNSNDGRRVRNNMANEFNDYGEQIGGIATEAGRLASNYAREAQHQGQQFASTARNKANEFGETARESVNSGKDWVTTKASSVKSSIVG
jgi:hypothetical protein